MTTESQRGLGTFTSQGDRTRPQEASKKLTGKLLPPELSRASVFKEMATHLTQQLWEETVHVSAFDAWTT